MLNYAQSETHLKQKAFKLEKYPENISRKTYIILTLC